MKPYSHEDTIQVAKPHGWEGGLAPAQAGLLSFLNVRVSLFFKIERGQARLPDPETFRDDLGSKADIIKSLIDDETIGKELTR